MVAENLLQFAVDDEQLHQRRAAHPVDDGGDLLALVEIEIAKDTFGELCGDLVGRHHVGALGAGLAVDPDPEFDLVLGQVERRLALFGRNAGRERHPHGADIVDDLLGDSLDLVEVRALGGFRARGLVDEDRPADPAPARSIERILDSDIVVDDNRGDIGALHLDHLDGGLEVHHVALVVLDYRQYPLAAVAGGDECLELVGGRRGEHVAGGRAVEHPVADIAAVGRLVAAAAAGDDGDRVVDGRVVTHQYLCIGEPPHARIGGGHPVEHFVDHIVGVVDQFLHDHLHDRP